MVISGILLLTGHVIRDNGKRYEEHLFARTGGFPTTRKLRLRDSENREQTERLRSAVEKHAGFSLPRKKDEQANPQLADEAIADAVIQALSTLRKVEPADPVLASEERDYGFRRNLRGSKSIGIFLTLAASAVNTVIMITTEAFAPGLINFSCELFILAMWIFIVTDRWVLRQAEQFASRFFVAARTNT